MKTDDLKSTTTTTPQQAENEEHSSRDTSEAAKLPFDTSNLEEAARFLRLLDLEAAGWTFQIIDDNKERIKATRAAWLKQNPNEDRKKYRDPRGRVLHGTLEEHAQTLIDANKDGCGVFVTINETNLRGRKGKDMVRIRALIQDDDGDGKPFPLDPHIIILSSPGKHHRYVLVDGPTRFEAGGTDKLSDEFKAVQERLVEDYGADPNVKDLPRVMRVPGFYHMKNPGTPHLVAIEYARGDLPISWQMAKKIFPPVVRRAPATRSEHTEGVSKNPENEAERAREALKFLDPDMEYLEWIEVGMALQAGLGDLGLELWDEWSAKSDKYGQGETAEKWGTFKPGGGIGLGTLYNKAKEHGFRLAKVRNWKTKQWDGLATEPADIDEVAPINQEQWGIRSTPDAALAEADTELMRQWLDEAAPVSEQQWGTLETSEKGKPVLTYGGGRLAGKTAQLSVVDGMPTFNVPSFATGDRPKVVVLDQWALGKWSASKDEKEREPTKFKPGVWFFGLRISWKDGMKYVGDADPQWVSSPLHILAQTHSMEHGNAGRLIRLVNSTTEGWEDFVVPMTMLVGRADQLWEELFSRGVVIDHRAKTQLMNYLHESKGLSVKTSVTQSGWVGETRTFALPDECYGEGAKNVVYERGHKSANDYTLSGTLEGWRDEVASLAAGNALAIFGISCAFSGPLLKLVEGEGGGGFHVYGGSSSGKTTILRVACSVWGGSTYIRTWRATANGLEGSALLFNDGFIALDEISQADGQTVGDVAYFITNGEGKQRANIHGAVKDVARWRLMAMSTGERSLGAHMREGQKKAKVGQEVRIIDIDTDRGHGAFDYLHGRAGGSDLANDMKRAAAAHHGHVGRAFLEQLTAYEGDLLDGLSKRMETIGAYQDLEGGQAERIARRFAMVGMAGELATHFGLTGWAKGAATHAAATLFLGWLGGRKRGDQEQHKMVAAMARFLETHGDSRFKNVESNLHEPMIRDMCGWVKIEDRHSSKAGARTFYLTGAGMEAVLATGHYDKKAMNAALKANGALKPAANGRAQRSERCGRPSTTSVYVIDESILDGTKDSEDSPVESIDSDLPF